MSFRQPYKVPGIQITTDPINTLHFAILRCLPKQSKFNNKIGNHF